MRIPLRTDGPFLNLATYRFTPLTDLLELRERLYQAANAQGLAGTILIASEGINVFIAGKEEGARAFQQWLATEFAWGALQYKESWSPKLPFRRLFVKVKREIIAFDGGQFDASSDEAPYMEPSDLRARLDRGEKVVLLDTRNDYEVGVGTFAGAEHLQIKNFRQFTQAVDAKREAWQDQTIVTFCTGGIRCEKAARWMTSQGFKNVSQLRDGILGYFEQEGGAHWNGECFVFDHRVAVNPELAVATTVQCYACRAPVSQADQQSPRYRPPHACPACNSGVDRVTHPQ